MPAVKAIRLSKAAKDLNVGLHRIVEFLASKDVEIASNPNSKIPPEAYELLEEEFGKHKKDKAEAEEITSAKHHKENAVHEAGTIGKAKKKAEPEPELDASLEHHLQEIKFGPGVAPPPKEEAKEEVIKAKSATKKPKVIGKIDVEEKKKPAAKKEEPVAKEETKEVAEPEKKSEEEEVIKAKIDKIKSPTILGKIELPKVPEKKKPVASSSKAVETEKPKRRKKRKRTDTPTPTRPGTRDKRGGKKPAVKKVEVTDKEIQDQIKSTLQRLSGAGKSKAVKLRKQKREDAAKKRLVEDELEAQAAKSIQVTEFVTVSELAILLNVPVGEIIAACMSLGLMVSINQRLDAETLSIVAEEFGSKVEFVSADVQEAIKEEEDNPEDLAPRPPIVTVMGHVDHGKTSLLDYIRDTNVIAGEAGGITQHIGAYEVTLDSGKQITFLDTPGHEAFTAMRARGAKVTDVAIIVIAADDSVMPQTVEAINHAQAAEVPIVFAFNKIDKPNANVEKIKEELANMKILVEDWGGKYQSQDISAKKGEHIDKLLEKVLLEAELLEAQANPTKNAVGTVLESTLDKGKGHVTTILVLNGTLRIGDIIIAGPYQGRVKAMFNERGVNVQEAGPAVPVTILGLSGAPQAGDTLNVIDDEQEAKAIANKRMQLQREQGIRTTKHITLDEIGRRLAIGNFKELNIIVKGDVDGSIEALTDSLQKLSTEQIQVNVIHKSVGQISESDVLLASASNAIIIGFQVRPSVNARRLAEKEQIDIRLYSVIYDTINEVKAAMEGMLTPEYEEKIVCNVEVREIFKIPKVGTVAGCMVLDGKVTRNTKIRVIRDGIVTYTGELSSLKRFKDDVKEVNSGYECGLSVQNFNDIKVGDIIEGYEQVAVKATL